MVKLVKKESENMMLGSGTKKPCKLLNMDLDDFTVTKHLLIAHNGGITLKDDGAIRTIICGRGNGIDHFERIMIAYSGASQNLMKEYLSKHPKAILNLVNKSDASITKDEDGNYTIDAIRDGQAELSVWRENDTELEIVIEKMVTLR